MLLMPEDMRPERIEQISDNLVSDLGLYTRKQADAIISGIPISLSLEEHGVHRVLVTYPWGLETRYGVQGMPGLWGYESVRQIMEAEEW